MIGASTGAEKACTRQRLMHQRLMHQRLMHQRLMLTLLLDVCSLKLIRKRQRITENDQVSVVFSSRG